MILWDNEKGAKLPTLAENHLAKGSPVYIEGEIEYRSWEDREGQKRYTTEIVTREVLLLGGKGETAPVREGAAKMSVPKGKDVSFEDFPEALDGDDDDLPF